MGNLWDFRPLSVRLDIGGRSYPAGPISGVWDAVLGGSAFLHPLCFQHIGHPTHKNHPTRNSQFWPGGSLLSCSFSIVEPAGVEPASANRSLSASTCVVRFSFFSLARRHNGRPLASQPSARFRGVSLPARWRHRRASPIQSSPPAGPRARSLLKTGYGKLMLTQPAPCYRWHLLCFSAVLRGYGHLGTQRRLH